jgi:molybdopterin-biosynthesis enzyme MoeA-like protein
VCDDIHIVFQVFLVGGLGPLHSDISLAGVAKAFGVRLVRSLKLFAVGFVIVGSQPNC